MFARKMLLSYPQILDMFDEVLTKEDRDFLSKYYNDKTPLASRTKFLYNQYFEYKPDYCEKFSDGERELFRTQGVNIAERNDRLFEVWHVVWRGEVRKGILRYINELGMETERVVDEGYVLNEEQGDISITWAYEPQVYEGYRIGHRYSAIYPIKARPIPYLRNDKLPYNGIMEILPFMGQFSIIRLITPYQVLRNIISYHREMVIAKNKMLILLLPESLIASETEDKIYKMAADGVLIVDDTEDANSQKMANIRMLNASMGDYITQLTNLMESIKMEAREMVDMNMQRYGEIAQSAGANVTQEAIARSSMGSVIITTIFDLFRCKDYDRDMDYAKLAYIDGLQTTFFDEEHKHRYLSLDVNSFVNADYTIYCKNNQKELEKLEQLKQWAFSAVEVKRQHESELKQADQMLEQQKMQNELAKIQAQGEEDRKTEMLKYQYEMQLKSMDVDMSILNQPTDNSAQQAQLARELEQNKMTQANNKLQLDREKMNADIYSKAADRQIKREQMANDLKIAKTNKNKYDK